MESNVNLLPRNDIEVRPNIGLYSTGSNPYFIVNPNRSLGKGDYVVRVKILIPKLDDHLALYIDDGNGYNSENVYVVKANESQIYSFHISLSSPVRGLRFDPGSSKGHIIIDTFRIDPVGAQGSLLSIYKFSMSFWENIKNILGLNKKLYLKPENQIEKLAKGWLSTGEDPFFSCHSKVSVTSGWHMVELLVDTDKSHNNSKFYIDYGEGFSEKDTDVLVSSSGNLAKKLIFLKAKPINIRFDPCEEPALINECKVDFIRVTEGFALKKIREKLIRNHIIQPDDKLEKSLLVTKYNNLFDAKITSDQNIAYEKYIEEKEPNLFIDSRAEEINKQSEGRVFFSVLMPTYNTDIQLFKETIASIKSQSFKHWELCIADDASENRDLIEYLNVLENDERIKVTYRQVNGNISESSNTALGMASGNYCVLMDHDDLLAEHALLEVASILLDHPFTKFVYSDEDKVDEYGKRYAPYFKPGWNPDLFYSQNYLNHLTVLQTERLIEVSGWRLGYEGAQDHDLYLRYLKGLTSNEVKHIPKVLYHWRATEGSTALSLDEKSYAVERGMLAVKDYFASVGQGADISMLESVPHFRVTYKVPEPQPLVSLIIPTRDMSALVESCVSSIVTLTSYKNFEILIVNNNSEEDETFQLFKRLQEEFTFVRVIDYNYEFNFSAINNFAAQHANGEILGLINNDIEIINSDWLTEMVSHAIRPEIGCVGAKLYYEDDTIQHAGVVLGIGGVAGHSHKYFPRADNGYFNRLQIPHRVSAVTAACLLVRKSIYDEVGGLNEKDLTVAFNDVDFCLKVMEKGYHNFWTPFAEAYHYESKSRGAEDTPEKQQRFKHEVDFMKSKWLDVLDNDPYYSPALSKTHENFSINI